MFNAPFIILLAVFVTVVGAFQRPEGGPDGIYVHSIGQNGEETSEYVGPNNGTTLDASIHIRAHPVKARAGSGPQCQTGTMDPNDLATAITGLASFFGFDNSFYGKSISSYWGSAVAYGCNYGNGQTMDGNSFRGYENALSDVCGNNIKAYYNIPNWKASYGRTYSSDGFC